MPIPPLNRTCIPHEMLGSREATFDRFSDSSCTSFFISCLCSRPFTFRFLSLSSLFCPLPVLSTQGTSASLFYFCVVLPMNACRTFFAKSTISTGGLLCRLYHLTQQIYHSLPLSFRLDIISGLHLPSAPTRGVYPSFTAALGACLHQTHNPTSQHGKYGVFSTISSKLHAAFVFDNVSGLANSSAVISWCVYFVLVGIRAKCGCVASAKISLWRQNGSDCLGNIQAHKNMHGHLVLPVSACPVKQ